MINFFKIILLTEVLLIRKHSSKNFKLDAHGLPHFLAHLPLYFFPKDYAFFHKKKSITLVP